MAKNNPKRFIARNNAGLSTDLFGTRQITSPLFILFCSLDKCFWLKKRVYDDLNAKEIDTPCK
jgi:hypothetical protein